MARTKEVARKSTGGDAPRVQLPPADPANRKCIAPEAADPKGTPKEPGGDVNTVRHEVAVYLLR